MILSASIVVTGELGLHARPAAVLSKLVQASNHQVFITNQAGKRVSGSSLLEILTLGVQAGESISFEVEGPDAEQLLEQLKAVVAG